MSCPWTRSFRPLPAARAVASLLLSVGVRTLFGWAVGVFFLLGRRSRHPRLWTGVVAVLSPKLHSALVYAAMGLLFPQLGYGLTTSFRVSLSDVPLAFVPARHRGFVVLPPRRTVERLRRLSGKDAGWGAPGARVPLVVAAVFAVRPRAAVATTFYFAQRMTYMLGVARPRLFGDGGIRPFCTSSCNRCLPRCRWIFCWRCACWWSTATFPIANTSASSSAITGVMGRKMFNRYCEEQLRGGEGLRAEGGWFSLWTWITSSPSTIRSATPWATWCSSGSLRRWRAFFPPTATWGGWAATSSPC